MVSATRILAASKSTPSHFISTSKIECGFEQVQNARPFLPSQRQSLSPP